MYNSGRQDPGGRNRRLRRLPHAGNSPKPDRRGPGARGARAEGARRRPRGDRRRPTARVGAVLPRARAARLRRAAARAVDAVREAEPPRRTRASRPCRRRLPARRRRSRRRGDGPGPLLKGFPGASVADLCAASARRGGGRPARRPSWRAGTWPAPPVTVLVTAGQQRATGRAGVLGPSRARRRAPCEPGPRRAAVRSTRRAKRAAAARSLLCRPARRGATARHGPRGGGLFTRSLPGLATAACSSPSGTYPLH